LRSFPRLVLPAVLFALGVLLLSGVANGPPVTRADVDDGDITASSTTVGDGGTVTITVIADDDDPECNNLVITVTDSDGDNDEDLAITDCDHPDDGDLDPGEAGCTDNDGSATDNDVTITDATLEDLDVDNTADDHTVTLLLTAECDDGTETITVTAAQDNSSDESDSVTITCDPDDDGDDDDDDVDPTTVLAPLPALLTMSVSPTNIPCGSSATINARLVYPSGEGVQHLIIGFSATRGTVFGNVLTNATGNVTTTYIAPPSPTTATITASVDGHNQSVAVNVTCAVEVPAVATQTVVRPPSTGSGGLAGGSNSVQWPIYAGVFFVMSSLVAALSLRKQRS
jgi:hypothetical protein